MSFIHSDLKLIMFAQYSSVASATNISLDSIEEKETEPWHELLHKLSTFQYDSLNAYFKESQYSNQENGKREEGLTKEHFVNAIEELFGNCKYSLQATILFDQIDREETFRISWNQILDFIIENSDLTFVNRLQLKVVQISNPPHVKRETIIKILSLETNKYFCYLILSKYGRVGIYDGNMNFLISYHIIMAREDIKRRDEERRRRNRWATDAIFLQDLLLFLVTTTARNITIYDASNLNHVILWLILGAPYVIRMMIRSIPKYVFLGSFKIFKKLNITKMFYQHQLRGGIISGTPFFKININSCMKCLSYYPKDENCKILFTGDDNGQIVSLNFLQATKGLLRRKHDDNLSIFYWIEMENEKDFVIIKNYGKMFGESINKIEFFQDNTTIVACSQNSNLSLLIQQYELRRNSYSFKMRKGASCFALSRALKVVLTGSDDGVIRKWNTVGTQKSSAILKGHKTGVVDIKILEAYQVFLSCSRDAVLKLWLIKEEICVQTVNIKFPAFEIVGKTIEWGIKAIYAGPKRAPNEDREFKMSHIYVACCNFLAKINLRADQFLEELDSVLPPPPLQNSVLIPSTWRINDALNKPNITACKISDEDLVDKYCRLFKFILDKKLLGEDSKINCQIADLEFQKLKMKGLVSQCVPYLVLDLYKVQNIQCIPSLPIPSKRIKNLTEKLQCALNGSIIRDQIFLVSSLGSRTRSSRSSLLSFD